MSEQGESPTPEAAAQPTQEAPQSSFDKKYKAMMEADGQAALEDTIKGIHENAIQAPGSSVVDSILATPDMGGGVSPTNSLDKAYRKAMEGENQANLEATIRGIHEKNSQTSSGDQAMDMVSKLPDLPSTPNTDPTK